MKKQNLTLTKKIFIAIGIILSAILVFIAGWLCVDKFINKSKVPSFMGYASLTVATGSMSGTIEEGDFIIIKNTGDYKIGDIITFLHPGEKIPTTHRIIQKNADGSFITKGDANNSQDVRVVTESEILGEVVSVWHGFGIFIGWLTSGGGFIYVLALILIVGFSVYILKQLKTEQQPNNQEFRKGVSSKESASDEKRVKNLDSANKTKGNKDE